jgi:hypothetical protein
VIAALGLGSFVLAFSVFWSLGARIAGGDGIGLPGLSGSGGQIAQAEAAPAPRRYPVAFDASLRSFRDLSYVPVKAIYVSNYVAGSPKLFQKQLGLADRTEINAMVIDVKDASGYAGYDSDVPLVKEAKLSERRIKDVNALMQQLRKHDVFPIARIVCFNDPLLATRKPELAIRSKAGGLWKDRKGASYTNPYDRRVWEYLVQLAEEAADRGFREIQFDYVRFPSDGKISDTLYPGKDSLPEDAIGAFLAYARERLESRGVWVSADVFGLTVYVEDDLGIGQRIEKVARNVDIVCPMVYPSHYYAGSYNIADPNSHPYEIVSRAMKDSKQRLDGTGTLNRPWLQDFSLGGVKYGVAEVKAQIKAAEEQGYREWILWDPGVSYTEGALRPAEG